MSAIDFIDKSVPTEFAGRSEVSPPLALGENCVWQISIRPFAIGLGRIIRWNLLTGEVAVSPDEIAPAFGLDALHPVNVRMAKGGHLMFDIIYTKTAEAVGSKKLYARWVKIDLATLKLISYGTERTLTGELIRELCGWAGSCMQFRDIVIVAEVGINRLLIIDMNTLKYKRVAGGAAGYTLVPRTFIINRADQTLRFMGCQHYWITDAYAKIVIFNPVDWTSVTYDHAAPGCGMFGFSTWYKDFDDRMRHIIYGSTCGYGITYPAKYNAIAFDTGVSPPLFNDFIRTAGSAYNTAGQGCRRLYVLGKTGVPELISIIWAGGWGGGTEHGISLIKTDGTLGSPLIITEKKWTMGEVKYRLEAARAYLLQTDWNYYLQLGIFDGGVARTARVKLGFDLVEENPYETIEVTPKIRVPTKIDLLVVPA